MKSFVYGLVLILASFLVGCEQELNLKKYRDPEIAEMLVVNSILNPDSFISVSVTRPYFFSDTHLDFLPVSDLAVTLTTDSGAQANLEFNPVSGMYASTFKPKAGESYVVQATDGVKAAAACDTVPCKVEIEGINATVEGPVHVYWDNDYRFTYKITFTDTPGKENYYFLRIEDDALRYEFTQMGTLDYTADYVFQVLANRINQGVQGWKPDGVFGYPFSDSGIDGESYTVTVIEVLQSPVVQMIEKLPRKVELYSISKAYYEYMVSVLSMDYEESAIRGNLLSLGLMEPQKIYTNVSGGAGLMGSYNLHTLKIDLLKEAGGWPGK